MVGNAKMVFFIFLLSFLSGLSAFESLKGPAFYSSASSKVDLSAVIVDSNELESEVLLLKGFPSGRIFVFPEPLRLKSLQILVEEKVYRAHPSEIEKQDAVPQRQQMWLFDGVRLCIVKKAASGILKTMKCPA